MVELLSGYRNITPFKENTLENYLHNARIALEFIETVGIEVTLTPEEMVKPDEEKVQAGFPMLNRLVG